MNHLNINSDYFYSMENQDINENIDTDIPESAYLNLGASINSLDNESDDESDDEEKKKFFCNASTSTENFLFPYNLLLSNITYLSIGIILGIPIGYIYKNNKF